MTNEIAESIAASLVREYLSRKGLKTTLQVLDEELPRDADSISNRQQLVKELHIEKIMKKNKEQSQPLKAMLEVITQSLLTSRPSSSMKNGDLGPVATKKGPSNGDLGQTTTKQGPSVTMETNNPRSGLRSSYSSKSQYPTVEDTDHRFDGFPTSQQTDDDDLLKPDPNFSYPFQKVKPKPAASSFAKKPENKAKTKGNNSDLVIEDSVEGETILGDGKAGVMSLEEEEDQLPTRSLQSRPRSTNKPRSVGLGMSGPIINTEETGRRKFNKPRPMSASKNQRLNIFENETPKLNLDSINPASAKTA